MNSLFKWKKSVLFALGVMLIPASVRPFDPIDSIAQTLQKYPKITIAALATISGITGYITDKILCYYNQKQRDTNYWDWDTINTKQLTFPENFTFGAATAAHQVETDCYNCTWSPYYTDYETGEKKLNPWLYFEDFDYEKEFGRALTEEEIKARKEHPNALKNGCEHETRYEEDMDNLADVLEGNGNRFEIKWSKVQPRENEWDEAELARYEAMLSYMNEKGIRPVVTLYHYTEPMWFAKKGGFEKKENVQHYVNFCKTLFERFGDKVYLWFTFNSPFSGVAVNSYFTQDRPPCKKDPKLTAKAMRNMLDAHVCAYRAAKELMSEKQEKGEDCGYKFEGKKDIRVGVLKNIYQLDPWRATNLIDRLVSYVGDNLTADEAFYEFFRTGYFNFRFPFSLPIKGIKLDHYNEKAIGALDFIGVNYYSHRYFKWEHKTCSLNKNYHPEHEERMGVTYKHPNNTIYPEGLYRALMTIQHSLAQPLDIPIYVTENGIGTDCDEQRNRFMKQYLYALSKAIQDGCDVRGYFCWSLLDNYEWGRYAKFYGLFKVDREKDLERSLKEGSLHYHNVISAYKAAQANEGVTSSFTGNELVTVAIAS